MEIQFFSSKTWILTSFDIFIVTCRVTFYQNWSTWKKLNFHFWFSPIFGLYHLPPLFQGSVGTVRDLEVTGDEASLRTASSCGTLTAAKAGKELSLFHGRELCSTLRQQMINRWSWKQHDISFLLGKKGSPEFSDPIKSCWPVVFIIVLVSIPPPPPDVALQMWCCEAALGSRRIQFDWELEAYVWLKVFWHQGLVFAAMRLLHCALASAHCFLVAPCHCQEWLINLSCHAAMSIRLSVHGPPPPPPPCRIRNLRLAQGLLTPRLGACCNALVNAQCTLLLCGGDGPMQENEFQCFPMHWLSVYHINAEFLESLWI